MTHKELAARVYNFVVSGSTKVDSAEYLIALEAYKRLSVLEG